MDDQRIAVYEERIAPIRARYRENFATLEASWVARRQAVIDHVESEVPAGAAAAYPGLIEFHSAGIDEAHERAVAMLLDDYLRKSEALQRELGF